MKRRSFAWSTIPNLVLRGPRKLITVRLEREGAEFFQALRIEADDTGANAEFVRAARAEFARRLAWCFLWVAQHAHRFPGRDRIALVRAALADPGIQAGQDPAAALHQFGERELARSSTLGALRAAWDTFAAAQIAAGRMGAAHARRAWSSLLLLLKRAGRSTADGTPLTALDGDLPTAFERATFAALPASAGPLARNRARNSIAATVRQARSVLSETARRSPEYRALTLPPSLHAFLATPVEAGEALPDALPAAAAMERLRRGRALMRRLAPRHCAALVLELDLGLRAGEAAEARWEWGREVETAAGVRTWELAVVLTAEYGPKGRSRRILLDLEQAAAWRALLAARTEAGPCILGLDTPGARRAVVDRLGQWLRAIGLAGDKKTKPNHLLRKLRASRVGEGAGLERARQEMGHGDTRTTRTHYQLAPRAAG